MLGLVLSIGVAVFFLVEVIRKLPGVMRWAMEGKRPWGCDLCMSLWCSTALSVACTATWDGRWLDLIWLLPGAGGVSLALLYWTASLAPAKQPELP